LSSYFTKITVACIIVPSTYSCSFNNLTNQMTITLNSNSLLTISVTITGFSNPKSYSSSAPIISSISSYSSTNYLIDQYSPGVNLLEWKPSC
jgi:hypothetical protein